MTMLAHDTHKYTEGFGAIIAYNANMHYENTTMNNRMKKVRLRGQGPGGEGGWTMKKKVKQVNLCKYTRAR